MEIKMDKRLQELQAADLEEFYQHTRASCERNRIDTKFRPLMIYGSGILGLIMYLISGEWTTLLLPLIVAFVGVERDLRHIKEDLLLIAIFLGTRTTLEYAQNNKGKIKKQKEVKNGK